MDLEKNKTIIEVKTNGQGNGSTPKSDRLDVMKTYKIYIDGKFPRTESGRYYALEDKDGKTIANICHSSRKDFREAVVVARKAQSGWAKRSAYNKGHILYRIAEMLEGRREQFILELKQQGSTAAQAEKELNVSIDRLLYYAGWCDKFQQIFSAVNPVASSHFNFSVPEPTGVVSIIAPQSDSLLGLVSVIVPVIIGGNTCIVLASETKPLCAVTFAEVLNSSDLPGGVVNILTGKISELSSWFVEHKDVNATIYCEMDSTIQIMMREKSAMNLKRIFFYDKINWYSDEGQSPYFIMDTQEIKTTWHPVENIAGAGGGY